MQIYAVKPKESDVRAPVKGFKSIVWTALVGLHLILQARALPISNSNFDVCNSHLSELNITEYIACGTKNAIFGLDKYQVAQISLIGSDERTSNGKQILREMANNLAFLPTNLALLDTASVVSWLSFVSTNEGNEPKMQTRLGTAMSTSPVVKRMALEVPQALFNADYQRNITHISAEIKQIVPKTLVNFAQLGNNDAALIALVYFADNLDLYRATGMYNNTGQGKNMRTLCNVEEFRAFCNLVSAQAKPTCRHNTFTPHPASYDKMITPLSKEYLQSTDYFLSHLFCKFHIFVYQLQYEHQQAAQECITVGEYFERVTAAAWRIYLENLSNHGKLLREILIQHMDHHRYTPIPFAVTPPDGNNNAEPEIPSVVHTALQADDNNAGAEISSVVHTALDADGSKAEAGAEISSVLHAILNANGSKAEAGAEMPSVPHAVDADRAHITDDLDARLDALTHKIIAELDSLKHQIRSLRNLRNERPYFSTWNCTHGPGDAIDCSRVLM